MRKTKAHNRRQERPSSGELLQVDGTPHQFFYGDDKEYCLHGFIDDATHQVTGLYMCENECMHGYLEVTRQTFKNFGVPLALYTDGSSIFFPKDKKLTTVDVSNCVSISGTTFVIETKEILHKKKIEICISKRIGLKARFNNKWYKITPLTNKQNKSLKSNDSVEAIILQFIYFNCLKNERLSA